MRTWARVGVHTVAPRSNSAWAKSDGRATASGSAPSSAASRRSAGLAAGSGSCTANNRATTRSTLPSTGTAGRPNAIAATAVAVYSPMPGSALQASEIAREAARRDDRARAGMQVAGAGVVA